MRCPGPYSANLCSWHVGQPANVARVQRDEALAAADAAGVAARAAKAERDARLELLRARARARATHQ